MRVFLAILMGIFGLPVVAYVVGRILLPEMGLTAPDYWTWFKSGVIGFIVYAIVRLTQYALAD